MHRIKLVIIVVLLLLYGIADIYFLSYYSGSFSLFRLVNPLLEFITYYNLSQTVFSILFHAPAIVLPVCLCCLMTKRVRRYYIVAVIFILFVPSLINA